jgi:hypothetical protein
MADDDLAELRRPAAGDADGWKAVLDHHRGPVPPARTVQAVGDKPDLAAQWAQKK